MNKKSGITIENPENLSINPHIEYVIKCVKEIIGNRFTSPVNITGYIRGAGFYKQLTTRGNKTVLQWADFRHEFDDNQFMQGIQLYSMPIGEYVGMVNVFDISASHRSQYTEPKDCPTYDEKCDSIVIAMTSKNTDREIKSQLAINPQSYGAENFCAHTNIVGIKNVSNLGTKWAGKGVGKRLLEGIDYLFSCSNIEDADVSVVKQGARTALSDISYHSRIKYDTAVDAFFNVVDTSKYVSKSALISELLFNEGYIDTFKTVESEAIHALQKEYVAYVKLFTDFKKNLKRVVAHDLTTGVATLFNDFHTSAQVTHYGSLDTLAEEHPTAEEKVAVLNIGMQNNDEDESFDAMSNYVLHVGFGRYEVRSMRYAITNGDQEGKVYYFLDDSVGTM